MKKKKIINDIKRIIRDIRLEEEKINGKPRSKSWDSKPSKKQERRKAKRELKKMSDTQDFGDLDG